MKKKKLCGKNDIERKRPRRKRYASCEYLWAKE